MKNKNQQAQPGPSKLKFSPENEGIPLPIRILSTEGGSVSFTADFDEWPAPSRKFTADAFSVVKSDDVFHLIFMQRRAGSSQLRALIDVQMTNEAALSFANALTVGGLPENMDPMGAQPMDSFEEPEHAVTLSAALARAAAGQATACIDFYYASAYSQRSMLSTSKLYVEPEVRIVTSHMMYLGFSATFRAKAGLPPIANRVA